MKAEQERTLPDGIHLCTYFLCTKFDISFQEVVEV